MVWEQHPLEHHLKKPAQTKRADGSGQAVCGIWLSTKSQFASGQYALTDKIEEVTCGRCKKTWAYRAAKILRGSDVRHPDPPEEDEG